MAGNQEPMPRHVIRSTGGRSRGWIPKRGGCAPTLTARGKLRARVAALYTYICIRVHIYLYRSAPYFSVSPAPRVRQALKLNSLSKGRTPASGLSCEGPNLRSLQISRGFYAKVEIKDGRVAKKGQPRVTGHGLFPDCSPSDLKKFPAGSGAIPAARHLQDDSSCHSRRHPAMSAKTRARGIIFILARPKYTSIHVNQSV